MHAIVIHWSAGFEKEDNIWIKVQDSFGID